jgi:hypothetical protein
VHFLRFELDAAMTNGLRAGAQLQVGVEHPAYQHQLQVAAAPRSALIADLD